MARQKKVKVRLGKSAVRSLNLKHFGPEPSIDETPDIHVEKAYTWYHYNIDYDFKVAKNFLIAYLESIEHPLLKKIDAISDKVIYSYISTSCWRARMLTNGFILPEQEVRYFEDSLKFIIEKNEELEREKDARHYSEVTKELSDKNIELFTRIDEALSLRPSGKPNLDFNIKDEIAELEIPEITFGAIHKWILKEYDYLIKYNPETSNDDFEGWDSELVIVRCDLIKRILNDLYGNVTVAQKTERKPRVSTKDNTIKKPIIKAQKVNLNKKLARVKYQNAIPEYNISGLKPEKLLNAHEAWLFNTKYQILYVLYSDNGFDINGTSIHNYNEEKSVGKKIGTRTQEKLQGFINSTKLSNRKYFDALKNNEIKVTGRLNENTVILKVY